MPVCVSQILSTGSVASVFYSAIFISISTGTLSICICFCNSISHIPFFQSHQQWDSLVVQMSLPLQTVDRWSLPHPSSPLPSDSLHPIWPQAQAAGWYQSVQKSTSLEGSLLDAKRRREASVADSCYHIIPAKRAHACNITHALDVPPLHACTLWNIDACRDQVQNVYVR